MSRKAGPTKDDAYKELVTFSKLGNEARLQLSDSSSQLTKETIRSLHQVVSRGEAALEDLVTSFMPQIQRQAGSKASNSMTTEDLQQEGLLGFLRAVRKFDPETSDSFSQFASIYVLQGIDRAIENTESLIRTPKGRLEFNGKVERQARIFEYEMGRLPTVDELAEILNVRPEKITDVINNPPADVSFESDFDEGANPLTSMTTNSSDEMFEDLIKKLQGQRLDLLLSTISEREALILRFRWGLIDGIPKTLEEIADEIGVTRERIRQIENKAISKLKHPTRLELIEGFI